MTKGELVELIISKLPYSNQIRDWDLTTEERAIRFTWRRERFRVYETGDVEFVNIETSCLEGNNLSILMTGLLKP